MEREMGMLLKLWAGGRNIRFSDPSSCLCLEERLDPQDSFERRTSGSHNVFRKAGIVEKPNLQRSSGNNAKTYQVRQVRDIILRYKLGDKI